MSLSRRPPFPLIVAITIVAFATLLPATSSEQPPALCLFCGDGATAGGILNVVLFLPLGIALGIRHRSMMQAILLAVAVSAGIELLQVWIPGRFSSIGDIMTNSAGSALGAWLALQFPRCARSNRRAARAGVTTAVAAVCVILGTGWLIRPSFPRARYWGQWTPIQFGFAHYTGSLIEAQLSQTEIPSEEIDDSDHVRSLLLAGAPVTLRLVGAPNTDRLSKIFGITAEGRREVLLLGDRKGDLIFRYRTLARVLRFEQPDLSIDNGLRPAPDGDTISIQASIRAGQACLGVNGNVSCGIGFTPGDGWRLLANPAGLPDRLRPVLDAGWLALLLLPVGFLARRRWETVAAVAISASGLAFVPGITPLLQSPLLEWIGGALGMLAGIALGILVRTATRPHSQTHQRATRLEGDDCVAPTLHSKPR